MLFFQIDGKANLIAVATSIPQIADRKLWMSRHDFVTHAMAEKMAADATKLTGRLHIGIDNGTGVWPRYDVVEAPMVGEPVSYGFNGDYYPDGEIVHVTPGSLRQVKTSTGSTYYRRKNSGKWVKAGGTWSMVHGHINERNPHF